MSDKHPEIECYECGRLKTRLIWNSRCVTCTVQRLEANLEENNNQRDQLAALKEENERLKARVAELEHAANEWADACINGLQHLKNIRDGISLASAVIPNMEQCIEHCQAVWAAALKEPANEG